jgi:YHS domain-containing protein
VKRPISGTSIMLLSLLVTYLAVGCGTGKAPETTQKRGLTDPPGAASLAILAKADASDGSVDKVVSKCVTCQLGMDGKPEYSVNYGGYAVHLCSEECRKTFSGDPEKALQALGFPEEKK